LDSEELAIEKKSDSLRAFGVIRSY